MFKRGCNKCGEFWYIGNPSTCKCQTNDHPKREWVSLTDEQILAELKNINEETVRLPLGFKQFARAIDAALMEKNNG
jgi:hypothetical protein